MKKIKIFFLGGVIFSSLIISCSSPKAENDSAKNKITDDSIAAGIKSAAEGEELFQTNCITCHSLRYIEMQPNFPRKTWEKITDKMIKNFGAPIPDSSAKKIVDYLMTIRGKKEQKKS